MSIRIVSDSTCDLPQELVDRFQIKIVPAVICFGSQKCLSGIDIDRELFYRKLEREDVVPTTSQPSPGQFLEAYNELAHDGHSILVITATAGASGIYQSAMLAKSMLPDADIEVIGSMSVSAGAGLVILAVARAVRAGKSKEEVVASSQGYQRAPSYACCRSDFETSAARRKGYTEPGAVWFSAGHQGYPVHSEG